MKIDQLFESGDDLASQFAQMAKEKGMNVRVRGTPDQERQRTQDMLAQRRSDQEKQSQLAGEKDFANLDQLEAEYAKMKDEYQSLGGSNWQYADREQNLSASERKARSMEDGLRALWQRIQRAKKHGGGLAEGDALADFLAKGGKIHQLPYKNPRKADKTDYGSKHIGTLGGKGTKGKVTGKAANVGKVGKPVVSAESSHPDEKEDKALIRQMVKQQALKKENMMAKEQHEDHRDNPMYGQDADFDNMLLRREARRKGMSVAQYKQYLEKQKQDQDYELNIGSAGRAELKQKADALAEIKREKLRNERLHDEETAFQRAETVQQRKDEMQKIADKYKHDLTVIDKEHRNNMEAIRTGNSHETNKMSMEFQHEKEMWDRNNPQQKPQFNPENPIPEPEQEPEDNRGNNFDQDTGATLRPQSNQWHTSQQVGYKPTKPTKPSNNDDIVDVDPKPNKPLAIKEKITVVKDPSKATGIQQTGGITHGSVYAGKPVSQPYRITPGSTYTPGKPLPQSLQQKLDGKSNTGRAVDAKGRTQQQWAKLVKAKFPDAKIMQSKMLDGPSFAMLPDGRKLSWNKVEQGVAEDYEISMATSELKNVYINAKKLFDIIKQRSEQEGLDAWQQSKITKASDYLNSVLTAIRGEPRR